MSEQRRQILQMLAEGKVTADEAERLIDALARQQQPEPPPAAYDRPKRRPKYLRVVVHSEDNGAGEGPSRINIRVPIQLLRAGVKLASLVPPQALHKANAEMAKSGLPIDLTQLKPEQLEELVDQLDEVTVDVDDPGSKVQIFAE
ncbi:hypothetical protein Aab01nite_62350 [Paractinoplanes abujensis]|uniref:YvlB/LiaX N-terminal domain-containing protein n=1 Tax=Paractinoplanes abujensis TaxID=882441 RepID=A0A7W7CT34_9ACTN|nr:hypothetical protein [Actinoplanes abujensis]MBB4692855.1 hypothetical protein [Actinoplanes abujensis]GID22645.1 hypothetical protein Aab01nite_62350 [Actinoplanes abujensis]